MYQLKKNKEILARFGIIVYLCNRFGEKSGLMKAFAIISRSAKSVGNYWGIKRNEIIRGEVAVMGHLAQSYIVECTYT